MPLSQRHNHLLAAAFFLFTLCSAAEDANHHPFDLRSPSPPSVLATRAYPKYLKHRSDKVHGVIMGLTVTLIFPLGAMSGRLLARVFRPRTLFWIHVGCQMLGLALLITGFGVGVWVAVLHAEVYNDPCGHVVLGTITVGLFLLQPIIGIQHHRRYKASKTNTFLRQGHVWFGRLLIVLALVNGGTGLKIGDNSPGGEKAYGVLAGVVGVVYFVLIGVGWFYREAGTGIAGNGTGGSSGSEVEEGQVVEGAGARKEG